MRSHVVYGRHGVVASGHPLASAEAVDVLRRGGNAVDAAVAAAAVLAVVLPYACGLGSDVFMLIKRGDGDDVLNLNGSGPAPAGATLAAFAEGIPGTGAKAATVPGGVSAWEAAVERAGTLSLSELLAPAITLAEDGFAVHKGYIRNTTDKQALLARNAEAARLFLPQGRVPAEGEIFVQPEAAAVLRGIADKGATAFYEGPVAETIVREMNAAGGLFSLDDLTRYRAEWQRPLRTNYAGCEVFTVAPNSIAVILLLALQEFRRADIGALRWNSPDCIVAMMKAWRRARERAAGCLGDPSAVDGAARTRLAEFGREGRHDRHATAAIAGSDTSNVVIVTANGDAVSLMQSVAAPFGAGVAIPGTGIILNNRMPGFDRTSGSPNCVAPGRRPAHTLCPALVLKDGRALMAAGSPGTVGQTCIMAQVMVGLLDHGIEAGEMVDAPRWSVADDNAFILEDSASPALRDELFAAMPGMRSAPEGSVTFGSIKAAIARDDDILAVADFRRVAGAQGW